MKSLEKMEDLPTRPLGNLEKYLVHQHSLSFYNNVQVATVFTIPKLAHNLTQDQFRVLIFAALEETILRHPILGYGLKDEDSNTPAWVTLGQIDLNKAAQFIDGDPKSDLDTWMQAEHRRPFLCRSEIPLWRLMIISKHGGIDRDSTISFAGSFSFLHVVGDGLSAAAFHQTFFQGMQTSLAKITADPAEFMMASKSVVKTSNLPLVPTLEDSMALPITPLFLLARAFKAFFYSPTDPLEWSGSPIRKTAPLRLPESNVRSFILQHSVVANLLARCREHKTTITALITAAVASGLASIYKTHTRFTSAVPFSLRKFSKHASTDMGCYTAIVEPKFSSESNPPQGYITCRPTSTLDAPGSEDDGGIWKAASECKTLISQGTALTSNLSVGLTRFIKDYRNQFLGMLGQKRRHAFVVTNIGIVNGGALLDSPEQIVGFDRVVFSTGASTNGAPYSICVASAVGGDLSIVLNWESGVVEDGDAAVLLLMLERDLRHLAE
ncbi:hypothetical protein VTL71DRAFT_9172 [Oculimacula yallundae]|uniref:Alcohol acetyltransferase n=1 Tax=Oculimacula yallundae TaxID=86028 RepID=A0ABR4BTJ3_9HELO